MKFFATAVCLLLTVAAFAQQQSPEEEEKQYQESINKEVTHLEELLKLEDWQVFYADSILNHDYKEMRKEMMALQDAKISNDDLYLDVQDKWLETIYNSLHGILDDTQWQKYLKTGAAKQKKDRDKRAAKRN